MQFACPYCNKIMQIQPDQRGQLVDCCHCGAMVEIPYRIPGSTRDMHIRILNKSAEEKTSVRDDNNTLYFLLGLFLSILGLLIASIAGGDRGCRAAWKGLLWGLVAYLFVCIIGAILTV